MSNDAKTIFEGDHIFVLERDGWQFVERKRAKEAVAVIARTEKSEVILTEQYRRPVGARAIDWPAGLVGDEDGSSDPVTTAHKELEEETGFRAARMELLAKGPSSPGITSEIISFYRAFDLTRVGEGGGVDDEDIAVHLVPLADIRSWLSGRAAEGVLIDLNVWSGLYFLSGEQHRS